MKLMIGLSMSPSIQDGYRSLDLLLGWSDLLTFRFLPQLSALLGSGHLTMSLRNDS